jgi:lysophospholipase
MKIEEYALPTVTTVLMIYTGGTIGMKKGQNGYEPVSGFLQQQLKQLSAFHDCKAKPMKYELITPVSKYNKIANYTILEFDPLLDSSNMGLADWNKIAQTIQERYEEFDSFIVIHGTDTMAFTASALSFMLENLNKTVIITGSQIPIGELRNDGNGNLLGSLIIAQHYKVPEVTIYFNNQLFRGNRSTKWDASGFGAFMSPNYPPLGNLGIEVDLNWDVIGEGTNEPLSVQYISEKKVACLQLYPGIPDEVLASFLNGSLVGIILETFGSGNAPDNRKAFVDMLQSATDKGVIIVNITQCKKGSVKMSYATGKNLLDVGVVPGSDMTTETALTKLMYVLSMGKSKEESVKLMSQSLRGELTEHREEKFSLKEKQFVYHVAQSLYKHPNHSDIKEIRSALFPVMICSLASQGALTEIKSLYSQDHTCIHLSDFDKRTPMHLAAIAGHLGVIKFLCENGTDISPMDMFGRTPLSDAIEFDQTHVAKYLHQKKAKLLMKESKVGDTMCHLAAKGELTKLRNYIEYGCVNPMCVDYDYRTPLHLACDEGNLEIAEYLVSQGADPTFKDRNGHDLNHLFLLQRIKLVGRFLFRSRFLFFLGLRLLVIVFLVIEPPIPLILLDSLESIILFTTTSLLGSMGIMMVSIMQMFLMNVFVMNMMFPMMMLTSMMFLSSLFQFLLHFLFEFLDAILWFPSLSFTKWIVAILLL